MNGDDPGAVLPRLQLCGDGWHYGGHHRPFKCDEDSGQDEGIVIALCMLDCHISDSCIYCRASPHSVVGLSPAFGSGIEPLLLRSIGVDREEIVFAAMPTVFNSSSSQ